MKGSQDVGTNVVGNGMSMSQSTMFLSLTIHPEKEEDTEAEDDEG